jgi:hypothetical protein
MRYYSPAIGRFLQPDPLGYEAEQYARETTPGLLKRNFPTLTQKEADQLSKDILDKLKWKDITANDFKLIVKPPKTLKDIPPSVKKHAIEFLNGLPATDQPSVKKILQILQPSASSPSTKPGTPA